MRGVPETVYDANRLNYCMICQGWQRLRALEGPSNVPRPRFDLMVIS
jgi:hypothetical protein